MLAFRIELSQYLESANLHNKRCRHSLGQWPLGIRSDGIAPGFRFCLDSYFVMLASRATAGTGCLYRSFRFPFYVLLHRVFLRRHIALQISLKAVIATVLLRGGSQNPLLRKSSEDR